LHQKDEAIDWCAKNFFFEMQKNWILFSGKGPHYENWEKNFLQNIIICTPIESPRLFDAKYIVF